MTPIAEVLAKYAHFLEKKKKYKLLLMEIQEMEATGNKITCSLSDISRKCI